MKVKPVNSKLLILCHNTPSLFKQGFIYAFIVDKNLLFTCEMFLNLRFYLTGTF